jgi:hypothetical protein
VSLSRLLDLLVCPDFGQTGWHCSQISDGLGTRRMGLTGDFIVEAMWQWHQTLSLDPCGEFPTRGKFASKPASLPEVGQTSSSSSRDGLAEAATEEGQWRRLTRRSAHGLPEDD